MGICKCPSPVMGPDPCHNPKSPRTKLRARKMCLCLAQLIGTRTVLGFKGDSDTCVHQPVLHYLRGSLLHRGPGGSPTKRLGSRGCLSFTCIPSEPGFCWRSQPTALLLSLVLGPVESHANRKASFIFGKLGIENETECVATVDFLMLLPRGELVELRHHRPLLEPSPEWATQMETFWRQTGSKREKGRGRGGTWHAQVFLSNLLLNKSLHLPQGAWK